MIEARGGRALAVRCDVTRAEDIVAALDSAVAAFGRMDFTFNCRRRPGRTWRRFPRQAARWPDAELRRASSSLHFFDALRKQRHLC